MNISSKHILGTLALISVGIVAYYQLPDTTLPDEGVKIATGTTVSSEAIETDTGKRLETLANSGTNWGMSPFGSGKPLTEAEKPKFQKPNLEWKARTINGITYRFGEGNPKEVALPESEMKACSWQEGGDYCTDNGAGYVDPLLEKLVYDLLNSPDWEPMLQNCEKDFRITDNSFRGQEEVEITYETLMNLDSYISLEEIFTINSTTGRKNITKGGYRKLMNMRSYLWNTTSYANTIETTTPNTNYTQCVDMYGTRIINSLTNIRSLPWRASKEIPPEQG